MAEVAGPATLVQAVHKKLAVAVATATSPQTNSVLHSEVMELRYG